IHLSLARGRSLFDAVMESRVVRLRPILLTATAAIIGAIPITMDPLCSGLAWTLIFGLFASTFFTLFVIPVAYWLLYANTPGHGLPQSSMEQEDSVFASLPLEVTQNGLCIGFRTTDSRAVPAKLASNDVLTIPTE